MQAENYMIIEYSIVSTYYTKIEPFNCAILQENRTITGSKMVYGDRIDKYRRIEYNQTGDITQL